MSKKCKIVDPIAGTSKSGSSQSVSINTDWNLCALCQLDINERLVDPGTAKFRGSDKECGYKLLAENLLEFHKLNSLMPQIDITRLNDGSGIDLTMKTNGAKWHKSCRNKYDNQKLKRLQKRILKDELEYEASPVKTRRSDIGSMARTSNCFFCDKDDTDEKLHIAQTDKIDRRVREYAHVLQDRKLLGKLSEGDMHALDAKYHLSCLTSLTNRHRKHVTDQEKDVPSNTAGSLVLAELVSYIEESRFDEALPVFKLSDLGRLYSSRMKEVDPSFSGKVNISRLKERLLHLIPDLRAQSQGRKVVLMFDADIGEAISIACSNNKDDDAIHLMHAAEILRKDILPAEYVFNGSFQSNCEKNVVPESVLAFFRMILKGSNIQSQSDQTDATVRIALSLSQLLMYNVKKSTKKSSGPYVRHLKSRETPLVIYTSLMIHAKTRTRAMIDKLASRGLCMSYERVQEVSTNLANGVCSRFERDGIVCPSGMKNGIFTVGAVDNIDHNPTSRNAMDSFHGTAISVIQFPTHENHGVDRNPVLINADARNENAVSVLPQEYSEVVPVAIPDRDIFSPATVGQVKANSNVMFASIQKEKDWLVKVSSVVRQGIDGLNPRDYISWPAYHANKQTKDIRPVSPISLMPLFTESANIVAMILHAMNLIAKVIQFLHPGQIPVITMDQPLFSIAKQIQWTWPDRFGENRFVVLMGGLYIEMNVLKLLGDLLSNSGWNEVLIQSEITTPGRADAILKGSHVTRSRYVHQVTAAALYHLQVSAFNTYIEPLSVYEPQMNFQTWCETNVKQIPQFQYWALVLRLELLALQFVRSLREADFELYVQCLGQLVPWMFALDHTNYSRWLPIHIKDMMQLKESVPSVYDEFRDGNFVVQKSPHIFSTIAIDQAHEQMNEHIKGDGGVIGITNNPSALIKWITAGPEIARIIDEFENSCDTSATSSSSTKYHDQSPTFQLQFVKHVKAMVATFEELGNPFCEDSQDLIALDTKEVLGGSSVTSLKTIESTGKTQYEKYVVERLQDRSVPVSDIIPKNNLPLFKTTPKAKVPKILQVKTLKSNCELFSRMYISCQSRNGDMDDFFKHENQAAPPSLSDMGELRQCTKSDLLTCFEKLLETVPKELPEVDAKILDGSVIVNMLPPKGCSTFCDYSEQVFIPYLMNTSRTTKRLDDVWDRYIEGSLKSAARHKRDLEFVS